MVDNIISTENQFVIGNEIVYKLEGVTGFSLKDDRALFGCSMTVTNQAGKTILEYKDLFADKPEGYTKADASLLNFTLAIGSPMITGGTYTWKLYLWDKRGKGEITATMPFNVVEPEDMIGISTSNIGLTPTKVFVASNGSLKSTDVKIGQKLTMFFDNINGFEFMPDSSVVIGASMVVIDNNRINALEYSDVFQNNPVMSREKAKSISLFLIVGDPMKAGKNYLWKIRVWDKNNQHAVESFISLKVME